MHQSLDSNILACASSRRSPNPNASRRVRALTWAIAVVGASALGGCQVARETNPLPAKYFSNDPGAQMDFWHTLEEHKVTSNDAAFHGLLLFADGTDPAPDYPGRVRLLKSRKLLPPSFNQPAEQSIDRGDLAIALLGILRIKGGLMLHLAPTDPRYATRELVFLDLYPPSSPNQTFSGAEFLGIIGKAEDFQQTHRIGPEPEPKPKRQEDNQPT